MKNISTILNIVLLVAVGYLYYLHFSSDKAEVENKSTTSILPPLPVSAGGIVFVNSDSLIDQYDYFKTQRKQLEESQARIKNELKVQGEKLQREIEEYQEQAPGMTDYQRQQREEQLALKQQQFIQKRDEAMEKLDEQTTKSSEELYDRLGTYLKEFNKDKNYQFILGYQRGGGILFANDSLNITKQVISGLNKTLKDK